MPSAMQAGNEATPSTRPSWQQILVAMALVALLGGLALAVRAAYPAHKVWWPAGAAVAAVALCGPRMLVAVAGGSFVAAYWWTGVLSGAALFAMEQSIVAGIATLLLHWPVKLDLRLHKLGDMGRFIIVAGGGYAIAGFVALAAVPESVVHVRADLAAASRHTHDDDSMPQAAAMPAAPHGAAMPHPPARPAHAHGAAMPHHQANPAPAQGAAAAHASSPAHAHAGSPRFEWALADVLGVLLVAPGLLFLKHGAADWKRGLRSGERGGAACAVLLLLGTTAAIYSGWLEATFGLRHTTLFVLPPAVWLALRYPLAGTLFGNVAVVLICDIGTSLGHGPFSDHTSGLPLLHLVFVGTTLLMAASQRERSIATAEVHRLATRDALTDLPNRNLLAVKLEAALNSAQRYHQRVGVLFIDLDHFKRINDSLGHAVGDRLLVAATERLSSVLRTDSTLARVGGDEFVAVMERLQDAEDVSRAASRIISALAHPFEIGSHVLTISCSVGVASYPDDGSSGSELIKNADIAMYQAKGSGRNQFRFFAPAMNEQVRQRLDIENGLRVAVQNHAFVLHYQPIVDARSGALSTVEALVRWRKPDGTLVMPGEFIHIAEETGLIESIGAWAIQEAARQVREWRGQGMVTVPVCVNLSARQLRNAHALSEHVRMTLQEQQLEGPDLVLEITESMLLHLGQEVEQALRTLSHRGITLGLDDFGTGYSSLGYLARLPIDNLKIDRSFVSEMMERPESMRLVKAMVQLAHLLGMRIIAEGVETDAQRSELVALGVDALQGDVVSAPVVPQAFAARYLGGRSRESEREPLALRPQPHG